MQRLNWSVVLPLFAENTLIGTIAIGPKLSGDPFYREDLNLLMTLANQAAVALKNAQRYGEVVIAHEYVARIVASIDSGVVAVNPLGQITLFNEAAAQLTGRELASANAAFVLCYGLGMLLGPQAIGLGLDLIGPPGFGYTIALFFALYLALVVTRLARGPSRT